MVFVARAVREVPAVPYGYLHDQGEDRGPRADRSSAAAHARGVDADVLEDLADEIATLSAHIHAATHRLLVLIADFDRLRGWEPAGYSNCARWLAGRTGIDVSTAREQVRVARMLVQLPLTSEAMARGELSFSQVRALSRVAQADSEAELLELARGTSTAQLERMVRAWKKGNRSDEATWARNNTSRARSRSFPTTTGCTSCAAGSRRKSGRSSCVLSTRRVMRSSACVGCRMTLRASIRTWTRRNAARTRWGYSRSGHWRQDSATRESRPVHHARRSAARQRHAANHSCSPARPRPGVRARHDTSRSAARVRSGTR